jgi:hypothetical protein
MYLSIRSIILIIQRDCESCAQKVNNLKQEKLTLMAHEYVDSIQPQFNHAGLLLNYIYLLLVVGDTPYMVFQLRMERVPM